MTYINSRFRIYCKAALCWGVGAKGSLGFEVDGNSFAAFMKSFLYMLRNVDYQKLEQMMKGDLPSVVRYSVRSWLLRAFKLLTQCIKNLRT